MEILLVRHGATAGNLLHRHIGVTDEPLCPEGRAALPVLDTTVDTVYVTPLQRTQQTAAILFPQAVQKIVEGLREMDFGTFENKNYQELAHDPSYQAWVDGWCEGPCPGGESRKQFCDRVCRAFSELVDRALEAQQPRLVIVAHGGTIMAVGEAFAVPKKGYFDWKVPNGGLCRFTTDAARWARREILTITEASS